MTHDTSNTCLQGFSPPPCLPVARDQLPGQRSTWLQTWLQEPRHNTTPPTSMRLQYHRMTLSAHPTNSTPKPQARTATPRLNPTPLIHLNLPGQNLPMQARHTPAMPTIPLTRCLCTRHALRARTSPARSPRWHPRRERRGGRYWTTSSSSWTATGLPRC